MKKMDYDGEEGIYYSHIYYINVIVFTLTYIY